MRFHRRQFLAALVLAPATPALAAQGDGNAYSFSFDRAEEAGSRSRPIAASQC